MILPFEISENLSRLLWCMKKIYFALFLLLALNPAIAQEIEPCGQIDYSKALEAQFPGYLKAQEAQYQEYLNQSLSIKLNKICP